jgi:hypothetical protein
VEILHVEMTLINSCCCVFSNRIGAFISAIYTFVSGLERKDSQNW